jgi:hypothetical protein
MKHTWDVIGTNEHTKDDDGLVTWFATCQCTSCGAQIDVFRDDFCKDDPWEEELTEEGIPLTCEEEHVRGIMES